MLRKSFVTLIVTAALGAGIAGMTSVADAKEKNRSHVSQGFFPFYGFHSDGFRSRADHYAYNDCGYRRVAVKKWNNAHTKRIKVYKKRWVCY